MRPLKSKKSKFNNNDEDFSEQFLRSLKRSEKVYKPKVTPAISKDAIQANIEIMRDIK